LLYRINKVQHTHYSSVIPLVMFKFPHLLFI